MNSNPARKHLFYTEMAKLLEAGFGVRQAISVILDTKPPADQTALLRKMDAGLAAGKSITAAFGDSSGAVTDLERSIIGAGERGGRLGQAFRHLADYFELLAASRRDALHSMIYPAVLLHLGIFIAVVPTALLAGESSGKIVVSLIGALLALYVGLALVALGVRAILKAAPASAAVDGWLNRLPVVGNARRSMAMARFTKVYHTGLLAGLTMKETVESALVASNSGTIRAAGGGLLATAKEGGALGPRFLESKAFPAAFARSYATAEEAGGLDHDIERWSRVYQDEAARGAKLLAAAIPKVCYGLVMIFVVWKILGFYQGYYGALDKIGED
jgi:type II secretory pathway component PulF